MNPPDMSAFVGKFVEEARDRTKALTQALMRLEKAPGSGEAIAEVLRQAHSLKGSARMLGLSDISQIAHHLEDLFVLAKSDPRVIGAQAFDLVFGAVDVLTLRVEHLATGASDPVDVAGLCRKLAGLVAAPDQQPTEPKAAADAPVVETRAFSTPAGDPGGSAVRPSLRVPIEKLDGLSHLAAEMVIESLKGSARLTELSRLEKALSLLRNRVRDAQLAPAGIAAGRGMPLGDNLETLDDLSRRLRGFLTAFGDDRVRLSLLTDELRQNVIELTMLPLATVFDAFPRAVRDLARGFQKEVELQIIGGETELDKKIIEQIADPLVHLVGNAVDHGIEPPDERAKQGKPAAGWLQISAVQRGNRILIVVQDDGRGIDPAEVRATAIRRRFAPAAELERWTVAEILNLVFEPGFSTRSRATEVSGRGVGMDVVKNLVGRLGGTVHLESTPGRGTTVTLDLPLSLALLRVVLIETRGEIFALPTAAVRRILHATPDEITHLQQGPVIEVDGEHVPLVALGALFHGPTPVAAFPYVPVIVAAARDRLFGLTVEAVHDEQEVVFEELRGPLRRQRTFAGAAIHGNGDIVPILNVQSLFDLAAQSPVVAEARASEVREEARRGRVLVVEDSLVAAEMQKNILIAAGYDVDLAQDGVHAFELLPLTSYDLVIADVDMPRMDGFELTSKIRADERFRDIPVIVVTARDAATDRRRGFEAGADAYVTKREFDQVQLLDTVRRLIGRRTAPDAPAPKWTSSRGSEGHGHA